MECTCGKQKDIKHKHRQEEEKKKLNIRLKKIEGQIRGISTMLDEDRYCVDRKSVV